MSTAELKTALMDLKFMPGPGHPYFLMTSQNTKRTLRVDQQTMTNIVAWYPQAIEATQFPPPRDSSDVLFEQDVHNVPGQEFKLVLQTSLYKTKPYIFVKPLQFCTKAKKFLYTR